MQQRQTQRNQWEEIALSRFFSFGKLFGCVFVTAKYEMKGEKLQVGVWSRERRSKREDGWGQLHPRTAPQSPAWSSRSPCRGRTVFSTFLLCGAPLKRQSLDSLELLLPAW